MKCCGYPVVHGVPFDRFREERVPVLIAVLEQISERDFQIEWLRALRTLQHHVKPIAPYLSPELPEQGFPVTKRQRIDLSPGRSAPAQLDHASLEQLGRLVERKVVRF
jgi:hypothetical protein